MSPLQLCEKVKEHDARLAKLEAAAKLRERTPFSGHIYADDVAAAAENYAPAEPRTDDAVEMIRKELPPFIANPIIAAIEAEREKHKADGQAARDSYGRLRQSLWNEQHSHGMTKDALAAEKRAHGLTQQKWDRAIGECERLREERNKYHRLLNEAAQATGVKNIILDRTPDAVRDVIATLRAKLAEAERERDSLREIAKVTERAFIDGVNAGTEATRGPRAQSDDGGLREAIKRAVGSFNAGAPLSTCVGMLVTALASHPAPAVSHAGESETGAESPHGDIRVSWPSSVFYAAPSMPITLGGHTMTVAEWAGLAAFKAEWDAKDGNSPGYNLEKARCYGNQARDLRARSDKALFILRPLVTIDPGFRSDIHSAIRALTATDADTATIPGVEWDCGMAFVRDQDGDPFSFNAAPSGDLHLAGHPFTRDQVRLTLIPLLERFVATGRLASGGGK
jgi:hypothetical protein